MANVRIKRGRRRSVIFDTGRTRVRVVPGRFRLGFRRGDYGGWTLALRLLLITVVRRSYAEG